MEKHLRQAQVYIDAERHADAARELRAALAISPRIPGAHYQLGYVLFQLGEAAAAEKAFAEELQFGPPDPYSLYYLGRIRLERGERRRAMEMFEKSLAAGEVLDVRQRLASGYLATGQVDKALQFLEESIRLRPEDGGLHYLLGRAYAKKGRMEQARAEFAAAARWKGKLRQEMEMLTRLRTALDSKNQPDAETVLRELSASADPDILLAVGAALGEAGLHEQAIPFLEKTLTLQPRLPEAHFNLGRAYLLGRRDSRGAEAALKKALELKSPFYEADVLLGTLLVSAGRSEEAIKHLRAAVQVRADSPRLLMMLGFQYYQQRYYPDAIEVLAKAIKLDPGNPEPRFLLIQAHYRNQDFERALQAAVETRTLFPGLALSYYHVGAQLSNFGRLEEAKEQLETALAKDPKLTEARVMLGDVLFRLGRTEGSLAVLRQVLAEDPRSVDAHAGVGRALIQLKRFPEAAAAMEEAIRMGGELAALHLYLSQAYRALGRHEEAKREVEVFNRLNRERAKARDQDVERKYVE